MTVGVIVEVLVTVGVEKGVFVCVGVAGALVFGVLLGVAVTDGVNV